ncbi:hypothetical protein QQF51_01735 [Brucella intermedia]|uniref:hypothetical protein n=1 Tax=Brucella intermedia TaxID=94625 RepID=UPI00255375EA|nr:hypothetical protein [Brucella intermedia]MDL2201379.1 hypothetical protein [Brucella intermedia]
MKHQYVGDINDYRKYALLRALSAEGTNLIGVCWMLTLDDGRTDGNKLGYLQQPDGFRHFDPQLFDILAHAAVEPDRRRLQVVEDSGAILQATYFNELLPDDISRRRTFMERCAVALGHTDLVFFDPDNGLEVSIAKGRKNSSKYLYLDEAAAFYGAGKSLLIYQHFPRIERKAFVAQRSEQLRAIAPGCSIWAFTTAHVVFFCVLNLSSSEKLRAAVEAAAHLWDPRFIKAQYLGAGEMARE